MSEVFLKIIEKLSSNECFFLIIFLYLSNMTFYQFLAYHNDRVPGGWIMFYLFLIAVGWFIYKGIAYVVNERLKRVRIAKALKALDGEEAKFIKDFLAGKRNTYQYDPYESRAFNRLSKLGVLEPLSHNTCVFSDIAREMLKASGALQIGEHFVF